MQPLFKLSASCSRSLLVLIYLDICLSHVFASLACCCFFKNRCVDKGHHQSHGFDTSRFLFQFTQKSLTNPELKCCFIEYECLVFPSPLVVLCVNSSSAFLMFFYVCVGCTLVFCLKVNWSACQLCKCNLCFVFWKLFWCSSRVLPCLNVPAWMHMLPFVFPCIVPRPAAFLVLCICCTN